MPCPPVTAASSKEKRLKLEDVEITTCRSGDKFSCIARHIPTGTCVECGEFFGIYRNHKKALAMLKEKLNDFGTLSHANLTTTAEAPSWSSGEKYA